MPNDLEADVAAPDSPGRTGATSDECLPEVPAPSDAADSAHSLTGTEISELRAAIQRISRRIRNVQTSGELSATELAVLGRLGESPMTPSQLARAEHVQPPSMTRTIDRLVERGLLQRTAHATDGRQVLVSRTDATEMLLSEFREIRTAWLADRFTQLDPAEQQLIMAALPALQHLSNLP